MNRKLPAARRPYHGGKGFSKRAGESGSRSPQMKSAMPQSTSKRKGKARCDTVVTAVQVGHRRQPATKSSAWRNVDFSLDCHLFKEC